MGERVHARAGGELRREIKRQRRITDRDLGDKMRAEQAKLSTVIQRDHGTASDLRAGARGGRNGDQRREDMFLMRATPPSIAA